MLLNYKAVNGVCMSIPRFDYKHEQTRCFIPACVILVTFAAVIHE